MRREFPEPVKRAIRERSGGRCETHLMPADIRHLFPKECVNPACEIDHVYPDVLEADKSAPLTADDGAHLCWPCHHLIKCREDASARKKRNAHKPRKDRPKSGWFHRGPKIAPKPIKSRGFSKAQPQRSASRPISKWRGA